MALTVGSKAPDFTLRTKAADGLIDVSLAESLTESNVVLLFYPGAFTHVCQRELCDVSANLNAYSVLGAKVFGISPDTPYALDAWAKQAAITVPLLSDYQHEVTEAYDVVWPNFSGLGPGTARAVFVIDRQGIIRHVEQTQKLTDMPDLAAIQSALSQL